GPRSGSGMLPVLVNEQSARSACGNVASAVARMMMLRIEKRDSDTFIEVDKAITCRGAGPFGSKLDDPVVQLFERLYLFFQNCKIALRGRNFSGEQLASHPGTAGATAVKSASPRLRSGQRQAKDGAPNLKMTHLKTPITHDHLVP